MFGLLNKVVLAIRWLVKTLACRLNNMHPEIHGGFASKKNDATVILSVIVNQCLIISARLSSYQGWVPSDPVSEVESPEVPTDDERWHFLPGKPILLLMISLKHMKTSEEKSMK